MRVLTRASSAIAGDGHPGPDTDRKAATRRRAKGSCPSARLPGHASAVIAMRGQLRSCPEPGARCSSTLSASTLTVASRAGSRPSTEIALNDPEIAASISG